MLGYLALDQSVILEGLNSGSGCIPLAALQEVMVAFPLLYPDNNIVFVCHAMMASSLINESP